MPSEEEKHLFTFSTPPSKPRATKKDIVIQISAYHRTRQPFPLRKISVHSRENLSQIRRRIQNYFEAYYREGFVFLNKLKPVTNERKTTVFNILRKIPRIGHSTSKLKKDLPCKAFRFSDVEYTNIPYTYDGKRYFTTCSCVIFLFEKIDPENGIQLAEYNTILSTNPMPGFSWIPMDIFSWKRHLLENKEILLLCQLSADSKDDVLAVQKVLSSMKDADNLCDENGKNPLHYAAENGNTKVCKLLLSSPGLILLNTEDRNGKTPMHCALYRKQLNTIIHMLQSNPDLRKLDCYGNNCFSLIEKLSYSEQLFIISKIKLGMVDYNLCLLFWYIAMIRLKSDDLSYHFAQDLPLYGDITEDIFNIKNSLLPLSTMSCASVTNVILSKHFPKVLTDYTNMLPFHYACKYGNKEHILLLFDNSIEIEDIWLGLRLALKAQKYDVCETIFHLHRTLLLDEETVCYIIEILCTTIQGILLRKHKNVVYEKMAAHLFPLLSNQIGALEQFVFHSLYIGSFTTLELLQTLGVEFNIFDEMGRTPLHEACQQNNVECANILLGGGANPNSTDWRNASPLHYACEMGCREAATLLINNTANMAIQDSSGRTPLMTAIYRGKTDLTRYLLLNFASKCNLNCSDALGQSILHYVSFLEDDLAEHVLNELEVIESDSRSTTMVRENEIHKRVSFTFQAENTVYRWKSLSKKPFDFHRSSILWNDVHGTVLIPEQKESPLKACKKCCKCRDFIKSGKVHPCYKRSKNKVHFYEVCFILSSEYHRNSTTEAVNPIIYAMLKNRFKVAEYLLRYKPELATETDKFGRNLIMYAIQQQGDLFKSAMELLQPTVSDLYFFLSNLCCRDTSDAQTNVKRLECLLSMLREDLSNIEAIDPIAVNHIRTACVGTQDSNCILHCNCRNFLPIEIAVLARNEPIFHFILAKTNRNKLGISMHLAMYFGLKNFVKALLHKQSFRPLTDMEKKIQNEENSHLLDIACRSPHLNSAVVGFLLKNDKAFVKSKDLREFRDLKEARSCVNSYMELKKFDEITPLAKLLSPKAKSLVPNKRSSNSVTARQKEIDNTGVLLIGAGINLEQFSFNTTYIHGVCEALYSALLSNHFKSAKQLVLSGGYVLWQCALTDKQCDVQKRFEETENYDNFISFLITRCCNAMVPLQLLKELVKVGKKILSNFEGDIKIFSTKKHKDGIQREMSLLTCPLQKLLLGVLDQLASSSYGPGKPDIFRLLKVFPSIFSSFRLYSSHIFNERLERTRIICREQLNEINFIRECIEVPIQHRENVTLLHLACSTGYVTLIKEIIEAVIPIPINVGSENITGALDVAAFYGNKKVVEYLIGKGAIISSSTFLSCCTAEHFSFPVSWTNKIHYLHGNKASNLEKWEVFQFLFERKEENCSLKKEEGRSVLKHSIYEGLDDIAEFMLQKEPTHVVRLLNEERDFPAHLVKCRPSTVKKALKTISSQFTNVSRQEVGQLLLTIYSKVCVPLKLVKFYAVENWHEAFLEVDNHGRNIMHLFAIHGLDKQAIEFINRLEDLEDTFKKCVLNHTDNSGASPLWYALAFKRWEIAKRLLYNNDVKINFKRAIPGFCQKRTFHTGSINGPANRNDLNGDSSGSETLLYQRESDAVDDDQRKEIMFLLQKAYIAGQNGCSLIHFASCYGTAELFMDIIRFSPLRIKTPHVKLEAIYALAILGNQVAVLDFFKGKDLFSKNLFKYVLWKILRQPFVSKCVFTFIASVATLMTGKPNRRPVMVRNLHDLIQDIGKGDEMRRTICDSLKLLLEVTLNIKDMEILSFSTFENNLSLSNEKLMEIMHSLLTKSDVQNALTKDEVLLLVSMNQPWLLTSIVKSLENNSYLRKMIQHSLLGNMNILDCILIGMQSDNGRSHTEWCENNHCQVVCCKQIQMKNNLLFLSTSENIHAHDFSINAASEKRLWILLQSIIPCPRDNWVLETCWLHTLVKSLKEKNEEEKSFMWAIRGEVLNLPLPDQAGILCLAAKHGKLQLVKYLCEANVPISFNTNNEVLVEALGRQNIGRNALHFAVLGKKHEALKTICNYHTHLGEFDVGILFDLAAETYDWKILKCCIDMFESPGFFPKEKLEIYVLKGASKRRENFCIEVIRSEKKLKITKVDEFGRTILHYCGMLGMEKLLQECITLVHKKDETDKYGYSSLEYAILFGHCAVGMILCQGKNAKSEIVKTYQSKRMKTYGWFRYFMQRTGNEESTEFYVLSPSFRDAFPCHSLKLGRLLRLQNENAASAYLRCTYYYRQIDTVAVGILRSCIKYNCNHIFNVLMSFENSERCFGDITLLILAIQYNRQVIAKKLFELNDVSGWQNINGENVLHLAVRNGDPEIINLVQEKTNGKLTYAPNGYDMSPLLYLAALGLPNLMRILLKNEAIENCEHDSDTEICLCSLLRRGIGWSKIYMSDIPLCNVIPVIDYNLLGSIPSYFYKYCKLFEYKINHSPVLKSILVACGLGNTWHSLLAFEVFTKTTYFPLLKHVDGWESIKIELLEKVPHGLLGYMLECAIVYNNEKVFRFLLQKKRNLDVIWKENFHHSIFETLLALDRCNLFTLLTRKYTATSEDFNLFRKIKEAIPLKHLWLSNLERLGAPNWPHFMNEEIPSRILKSDAWLIKSAILPSDLKSNVESEALVDKIELPDINHVQIQSTTTESFETSFSKYSEVDKRCLLSSTTIIDSLENFITCKSDTLTDLWATFDCDSNVDDPQESPFKAIYIRLSEMDKKLFPFSDSEFATVERWDTAKRNVEINILPIFAEKINSEFGLDITIDMDWDKIYQTDDTEAVLETLTGEKFNNKLGGLEGTLEDCVYMKNDIESLFTEDSVRYAIERIPRFSTIMIVFDERVSFSSDYPSHENDNTVYWVFHSKDSKLCYDRRRFPVWYQLQLYWKTSVALHSSIYKIANINSDTERQSVSLHIDIQSFELRDHEILSRFLCEGLYREIMMIACYCDGLLRLRKISKKVKIVKASQSKPLGLYFAKEEVEIRILYEISTKKVNTCRNKFRKFLLQAERRQLEKQWHRENTELLTTGVREFGFEVHFILDERSILSKCLKLYQREMSDPLLLIQNAVEREITQSKRCLMEFLKDIYLSLRYPVKKESNTTDIQTGFWKRTLDLTKINKGNLVRVCKIDHSNISNDYDFSSHRKRNINLSFIANGTKHPAINDRTTEVWERVDALKALKEETPDGCFNDLLLVNDAVYYISDRIYINEVFDFLPRNVEINGDTIVTREGGNFSTLEIALMNFVASDIPSVEVYRLLSHAKDEIVRICGVTNVQIDWRTFISKSDIWYFGDCIYLLLWSLFELVCSVERCCLQQKRHEEMLELLSSIRTLRISQESDEYRQLATDMKSISSKGIVISLKHKTELDCVFMSAATEPFTDLLRQMCVFLAEEDLKSYVADDDFWKRDHTDTRTMRFYDKKDYELILDQYSGIRRALAFLRTHTDFDHVRKNKIHDIQFSKSEEKSDVYLKRKVLTFMIGPIYLDMAGSVHRMHKVLNLKWTITPPRVPVIGSCIPPKLNKEKNVLTFPLKMFNFLDEKSDFLMKSVDAMGIRVDFLDHQFKKLQDLHITEQLIHEQFENTLIVGIGRNYLSENIAYMKINHELSPESCIIPVLKGYLQRKIQGQTDIGPSIKARKNDKLYFLVKHDTFIHFNRNVSKERKRSTEEYVEKIINKVKFSIVYKKKTHKNKAPVIPYTITQVGKRYSPSLFSTTKTSSILQGYSLTVRDSTRHFRLQAQCVHCQTYLGIITSCDMIDPIECISING